MPLSSGPQTAISLLLQLGEMDHTASAPGRHDLHQASLFNLFIRWRRHGRAVERSGQTLRCDCAFDPSRLDVTPSLLLQFHHMDDAGGNDGRFGHNCYRMALFLLHSLLGVVAGGELDFAWKRIFLNPLEAILHW